MKLKQYQQDTVNTLSKFFKEARLRGPKVAFDKITQGEEQAKRLRGRGNCALQLASAVEMSA